MAFFGRRVSTDTDSALAIPGSTNQVGQIFSAMPENGWLTAIGILGGKDVGQPNLTWRGALYTTDGASLLQRITFTGPLTVSNAMSYGGDGALLSQSLTGVQLSAGVKYGFAFGVSGGNFRYGMKAAALSPTGVSDYYFHRRNLASGSTPTDPFGATSITNQGAMDMWVAYDANVAPTTTFSTMLPSGTVTDPTPSFFGDWSDANAAVGDTPNEYQIQLRQVGTSSLKWNSTYGFSSTEKTAKQFSRSYEGTALTSGTSYEWRYRVSDQFGAWSDYSAWKTITLTGAGAVNVSAGTPTGKQETQTPGPWTGVWTHTSALSTNAVQLRVFNQGQSKLTAPIRISPTITKTVANNGTISITWAEAAFANLAWGSQLVYNIRARATDGIWSEWSADRAFTINASPTTPTLLAPANGSVTTVRPLLQARSTDADDTVGTGFVVTAHIRNSAGTQLQQRGMTLNGTTGIWEYQTTAVDLASFATYTWDVDATDGTVTTPLSSRQSFVYADGPAVTVTSPTELQVLTTNTPTITYTQNQTQVSHALDLYLWDTVNGVRGDRVYWVDLTAQAAAAGAGGSFAIPAGVLHDGYSYAAVVTSVNNLGLSGTLQRRFSVDFPTEPAPTGLDVSPILVGNDVAPSAIMLSFNPYPGSYTFRGTAIYRRVAGQSFAQAELLNNPLASGQTAFVDYYPRSGVTYTYSVVYLLTQGTDDTESAPAEADAGVTLKHVVLNSATAGGVHAGLRYGQPLQIDHDRQRVELSPWGQKLPRAFEGDYHRHIFTGTFDLQDDRYSTGADDLADIHTLHDDHPLVVYRDWFGTLIIGTLDIKETLALEDAYARVAITLKEVDATLGTGQSHG